jgi:hypothetical protein
MISNEWVEGVTKIANYNISKAFPILGNNYFKSADVRYILEANLLLQEEWEKENGNNRSKGTNKRKANKKT